MNKEVALNLILKWDSENSDSSRWEEDLGSNYTYSLLGSSLISKKSYTGRFSHWLNRNQRQHRKKKDILQLFSKTWVEINQDTHLSKKLTPSIRIKVSSWLSDNLTMSSKKIPLPSIPKQLKEIEVHQQQVLDQHQTEVKALSLLVEPLQGNAIVTSEEFDRIFQASGSWSFNDLNPLNKFLKVSDHLTHSEYPSRFKLLHDAFKFNAALDTKLSKNRNLAENRREIVQKTAETLAREISSLEPTKKRLISGSLGRAFPAIQDWIKCLLNLVPSLFSEIPQQVIEIFKTENEQLNPVSQVQDLIIKILDKVENAITSENTDSLVQHPFIKSLFIDSQRHLANSAAKRLPNFLIEMIEGTLKEGVLGNLAELFPDGEWRERILDIANSGETMLSQDQRKELINKWKKGIAQKLISPIEGSWNQLGKEAPAFLREESQKMPEIMRELLGIDFNSSPLLVEIEKQNNGQFTVVFYASNADLALNPKFSHLNQWPLVIKNVEHSRLNEKFFERLLFYITESQHDPKYVVNVEDVYKGLITYLGGTIEKGNQLENQEPYAFDLPNDLYLAYFGKKGESLEKIQFEYFLDIYKKYSESFIEEDRTLVIKKEYHSRQLLHGIDRLIKLTKKIEGNEQDSDRLKRLYATKEQIALALDKHKQSIKEREKALENISVKLPLSVYETLRVKISPDLLEVSKEPLIWLFGEEFRDLFEDLIIGLKKVPKPKIKIVPGNAVQFESTEGKPKGLFRSLIYNKQMESALRTVRFAWHAHAWTDPGAYSYLKKFLSFLLEFNITPFLPKWLKKPFQRIIDEIHRAKLGVTSLIVEYFFRGLALLFTFYHKSHDFHPILNWAFEKKQMLRANFSLLTQTSEIQYSLDSTKTFPPPSSGRSLSVPSTPIPLNLERGESRINASIAEFTLPTSNKILPKELKSVMQSWMHDADQLDHQAFVYLVKQIETLDIPKAGIKDYWDTVPSQDIHDCMEVCSELFLAVYEKIPFDSTNKNFNLLSDSIKTDTVITFFTLTAILHKLALRCPDTNIEKYSVNGYCLVNWYKHGQCVSHEPNLKSRLKDICQYFTPNLDLNKIPSLKELKNLASSSLFDYSFLDTSIFLQRSDQNFNEFPCMRSATSAPELRYIDTLITRLKENPSLQEKLPVPYHSIKEQISTNHSSLYPLIFDEMLVFFGRETIVPRGFSLLRFHFLLGNSFISSLDSNSELPNWSEIKGGGVKSEGKSIIKQAVQPLDILKDMAENLISRVPRNPLGYIKVRFPKAIAIKDLIQDPIIPRDQSSIIASPFEMENETVKELGVQSADMLFEMIFSEKRDTIVRALAFFKEFKAKLTEINNLALLQEIIFSNDSLNQQINESAGFPLAMAAFFEESLEYLISSDNYTQFIILAGIWIKVEKYCLFQNPEIAKNFFSIRGFLDNVLLDATEPTIRKDLLRLKALSVLDSHEMSSQQRFSDCLDICKAFFNPNTSYVKTRIDTWKATHTKPIIQHSKVFLQDEQTLLRSFEQELTLSFTHLYWKRFPEILSLMKNFSTQTDFLNTLFEEIGISYEFNTEIYLQNDSKGKFYLDNVQIDFITGFIGSEINNNSVELSHVRETALRLGITQLLGYNEEGFTTDDGRFVLKLNPSIENNKIYLTITLKEKGVTYTFQHVKNEDRSIITYWLEDKVAPKRRLLILKNSIIQESLQVKMKSPGSAEYTILGKYEDGSLIERFSASSILFQILPVSRFSHIENIECWKKVGEPNLYQIDFNQFQLSFKIIESQGALQAVNYDVFPGYMIDPRQTHPALNGFSSYLLLRNESGKLKVLLPSNQWFEAVFWNGVSSLGSLKNLVGPWIHQLNKIEKGKYLEYDISEDNSLITQNPKAILELILHYVIQGEFQKAERACSWIEDLSRHNKLETDLSFPLICLTLNPSNSAAAIAIRSRLIISLEENQLMHSVALPTENLEGFLFSRLIAIYFILNQAANETDSRYQLFEEQEWLLYQRLFYYELQLVLAKGQSSLVQMGNYIGWETLLEKVSLPSHLHQRYFYLKNKFSNESSTLDKSFLFMFQMAKTPSAKIFSDPNSIFSKINGSFPTFNWADDFQQVIKAWHSRLFNRNQFFTFNESITPEVNEKVSLDFETGNRQQMVANFFSYYAIAKTDSEKKKKLETYLLLNAGGWDPQSNFLMHALVLICSHSMFYPDVKEAIEFFKTSPASFYNRLCDIEMQVSFLEGISATGAKMAANFIIGQSKKMILKPLNTTLSLIGMTSRAVKALNEKVEAPEIYAFEQTSLNFLKIEEDKINQFLRSSYESTFSEVLLNGTSCFSLKNTQEALWQLYFHLSGACQTYRQSTQEIEQSLIKAINMNTKGLHRPIEMRDILYFFLKGNFYGTSLSLDLNLFPNIDTTIAIYLFQSIQLQHFERIVHSLEALSKISPETNPSTYTEKIQQIESAIKSPRAYSFDNSTSPRILRRLMLFEFHTYNILWNKQVSRLKDWLSTESGEGVIELLMSLGKTWFCTPTAVSHETSQGKLVFVVSPRSLLGQNVTQMSKQGKEIFHQNSRLVSFNRSLRLSGSFLKMLNHVLIQGLNQGEPIHLCKETAQSIELSFIDSLYHLSPHKGAISAQGNGELLHLQTILKIMRRSDVIGDEAQELFSDVKVENYPCGKPKVIKPAYFNLILDCFEWAMEDEMIRKAVLDNELNQVPKAHLEQVYLKLAKLFSKKFQLQDPIHEEFVDFVLNRSYSSNLDSHSRFGEFALVKGMLTSLLPLLMTKKIDVDFGPSLKKNSGEWSRPYEGNMTALENASIQNPFEAAVDTVAAILYRGLSLNQLHQLIQTMHQKTLQEMDEREVAISDTKYFQLLLEIYPESNLSSLAKLGLDSKAWGNVEKTLKHNTKCILLYAKFFLHEKIAFWDRTHSSNAQNFNDIFYKKRYGTGTPYNDGCFPAGMPMLWDPGTTEEAIKILTAKCPVDGIKCLKKSKPKDVLREVLADYFKIGSNFTAIIDGGVQLKGLSPLVVAKEILDYITEHRPDIQGVNFYQKDELDNDQLMSWIKGMKEPIPYDQVKLPLEVMISYFDHVHGYGANIIQKRNGIGFHLLGEDQEQYLLLQQFFRMRGVKDFIRFIDLLKDPMKEIYQKNLEETQTIRFGITPQVLKSLNTKLGIHTEQPTIEQIIEFATRNQKDSLLDHHYNAYQQKVKNVVRRAILDKILFSKDLNEMVDIFLEFEKELIEDVENDPKKLYGTRTKWMDTITVLESIRNRSVRTIESSKYFSTEEYNAMVKQISDIAIPEMPKTVKVYKNEHNEICILNESLGHQVHHEAEEQLEMDRENFQENTTENETTHQVYNPETHHNTLKEIGWSSKLSISELNWLKFSPLKHQNGLLDIFSFGSSTPPLYKLTDLLEGRADLKDSAHHFDSIIWFSHNFLPIESKEGVEVGSVYQRPLYQLLIHVNEETQEILSVGCLSQKDADIWRNLILKGQDESEKNIKVLLWDMTLRSVVAGNHKIGEHLKDYPVFVQIECQLKYLNADVNYESLQKEILNDFLKNIGLDKARIIFTSIYAARGKHPFAGSDIESILGHY